jgi:hypothetical protein
MIFSKCIIKYGKIKKIGIKQTLRFGIITSAFLAVLYGIYFLYDLEMKQKYAEQKYPVFSYDSSTKLSYKVINRKDQIFDENILGEGLMYMNNSIDHIETNVDFMYKGSLNAHTIVIYNLIGTLEGYTSAEEGNKSLWKKMYNIIPKSTIVSEKKMLILNKKFDVNLNSYNTLAKKIIETLQFSHRVQLTLAYNIEITSNTTKGMIKEKLSPFIVIPINENLFEIKGEQLDKKNGTIDNKKVIISESYFQKRLYAYSGIILLILILGYISLFTKSKMPLSKLYLEINKIFKEHGYRMVGMNTEVTASMEEMVQIDTIEGLVKIADDIGRPIFYKASANKEEISKFYVFDLGGIFVYDAGKNHIAIQSEDMHYRYTKVYT